MLGKFWLLVLPSPIALLRKGQCVGARHLCAVKPGPQEETYRQLDNLNMMTAAKILFSDPPKKKKFGLDFHLIQFFFACMPSLAVYLVAQYARHEIRRMEAEVEIKKKAEEEVEAERMREEELKTEVLGGDGLAHSELSRMKERVEILEASVKEIAVETKKILESQKKGGQAAGSNELVHPVNTGSDGSSGVNAGTSTSD